MNWSELTKELVSAGMTQSQIAKAIHTSQSNVSYIFNGARKSLQWDTANALIELHKKHVIRARRHGQKND